MSVRVRVLFPRSLLKRGGAEVAEQRKSRLNEQSTEMSLLDGGLSASSAPPRLKVSGARKAQHCGLKRLKSHRGIEVTL